MIGDEGLGGVRKGLDDDAWLRDGLGLGLGLGGFKPMSVSA